MGYSKFDEAVSKIKDEILSFQAGEKLPTVRELSKRLKVSKATVEKAMLFLELKGYLKKVPRHGSIRTEFKEALIIFPSPPIDELPLRVARGFSEEAGFPLPILFLPEVSEKILAETDIIFMFFPSVKHKDFPIAKSILNSFKKKVVLVDKVVQEELPHVIFDDEEAGYKLARALFQRGCRKIAFLYYEDQAYTVMKRLAGMVRAAEEFSGIEISRHENLIDPQEAKEKDVLVASTDMQALRNLIFLLWKGVRIPQETKIVSFGIYVQNREVLPMSIAGIAQPLEEMGKALAKIVKGEINIFKQKRFVVPFGIFQPGDTFPDLLR